MRILVTAASKHGATAEIATELARDLREAGLDADVKPSAEVEDLEPYGAVVIGSAVYVGHWLPEATQLVERLAPALRDRAVWLFSSGPIGSPEPKPLGDPEGVAELLERSGARGHRVFAGLIDRRRLGLGEKAVLLAVRAKEGDYRDWQAIAAWAREIASELRPQPVATPA